MLKEVIQQKGEGMVLERLAVVTQAKSSSNHFTSTGMVVTANRLKITSVGEH